MQSTNAKTTYRWRAQIFTIQRLPMTPNNSAGSESSLRAWCGIPSKHATLSGKLTNCNGRQLNIIPNHSFFCFIFFPPSISLHCFLLRWTWTVCMAQATHKHTHTHTQTHIHTRGAWRWVALLSDSVIKVERILKRPYCGFILFFHEGSIPPKLDKRILMGRLMDCD